MICLQPSHRNVVGRAHVFNVSYKQSDSGNDVEYMLDGLILADF